MPNRPLRLGTRRSALAMAQSGQVARWLEDAHPGLRVELDPIVTEGDRLPGDLSKAGGKGLFTVELEKRLREGTLDLAVHSLKDLPVEILDGTRISAYPERVDPRDALLSHESTTIQELPEGATILTGASRRRSQLLALRPDLDVRPLRGNVETRIRKWQASKATGLLLAAAGLSRLGIADQPIHPLDAQVLIPAPGQGILAVQTAAEGPASDLCQAIDHPPTRRVAETERALVARLDGDCALPLAAWARSDGAKGLRLLALVASPDGRNVARAESIGEDPMAVAAACADLLRSNGADEILDRVRRGIG